MTSRAQQDADLRFMRQALGEAAQVVGRTSPNPAVGCVIVKGGRVIARAATALGGRPHAEPHAIRDAGRRAAGATAYVTFEPCAHFGQTPPCADSLIAAGIKRAVIGCLDPYPPVRGRGAAKLRRAGIAVEVGLLEAECRRLNEGFITRITKRRPFVLLKMAMSLDGRIGAPQPNSGWISSEESRALSHRWRNEYDAVMVGAGTVLIDDPRLNCRFEGGRDPVRIVVDAALRTPPRARVYRLRSPAPTVLVTVPENLQRAQERYARLRVEVMAVRAAPGGVDVRALMRELAARGWSKILLEGGAHLAASMLGGGMVDRVAFFIAPRIFGAGTPAIEGLTSSRVRDAIEVANLSARRVGSDWLLEGELG
ncbi:MAG: bifunctional diaminohydroxyphosphoribosylaminopyrimidine deaminase/5-amino-6-(5-phosphoribosylamino)uracil reductase RibD [Candidatus Binataceae bacterium]